MEKIKVERETPIVNYVKLVSFDEFVRIDTQDVHVDYIEIDPDEKKALIHYRE